jgi:alpha-L-fucosidase
MKKLLLSLIVQCIFKVAIAQQTLPLPSQPQLAWHNMEFYLFAHFGPNTFTGAEWGHGDEKEEVFNPSRLDCNQWVRTAKAAGAKAIIITAKHHDGFCLWPSKYSTHTVRESKWKNGKGDVLKELSAACKAGGIKFGVYLSPWDRNHPKYGTPEYNTVFVNMMTEIFISYGPIFELWWDGANGEGPNGKKQLYDWDLFKKTVKKLSPNTVVFSDIGPHIRWVGNENGIAGKTNWNTLDTIGFQPGAGAPSTDTLNRGNIFGKAWIPAECDVSIRPGWFYHKEEDEKVKSPATLFNLYLQSVGRGATLLLNVPPDGRGLLHSDDSVSLAGFRHLVESNFSKDLAVSATRQKPGNGTGIALTWKKPTELNCIVLREQISKGQTIARGHIEIIGNDGIRQEIPFTTIGRKRIITFQPVTTSAIKIMVDESKSPAVFAGVAAYKIDDSLVEQ